MANKTLQIRIESILGGRSPSTNFGTADQFQLGFGIDPSLPNDSMDSDYTTFPGGLIRPVAVTQAGTTTQASPLWIISNPKATATAQSFFIYDAQGSAYTTTGTGSVSNLSDRGTLSGSSGNGCEYYDNFIYFAKNTTISRYGPLDASDSPDFTEDYWTGTLGKTALSNTGYPDSFETIPNHVLKRHSDGKLYVADVVGNQGTIHYISTTKTTYEGDTDNGSTYDAVNVGYGLYPTAMESYGTELVVAFYEGANTGNQQTPAKLAFWDTTSNNVNKIVWVEFPDPLITAMKNVNGILYVISGQPDFYGLRVSRFVGGSSFEEVALLEDYSPTLPGGVAKRGENLVFGTGSATLVSGGTVYSLGLPKKLSTGLFTVALCGGNFVTALATSPGNLNDQALVMGVNNSASVGSGIYDPGGVIDTDFPPIWWSQRFRIGQPFKITKIRIPVARAITTNMEITPTIYTDDGEGDYYPGGSTNGFPVINNTNYSGKRNIVMRPENMTGENNFWLELKWTGSVICSAGLPITIEYELIDD